MVWKITPEELLVRYGDGERNFAGIELIDSEVSSRKFRGIDLENVVLRDINLRGAYFDEVFLTGADLTGADLSGIIYILQEFTTKERSLFVDVVVLLRRSPHFSTRGCANGSVTTVGIACLSTTLFIYH